MKEKRGKEGDDMAIYDYIVNHVDTCVEELPELIARLREADMSGQFLASTARFLAAVDRKTFDPFLVDLVEGAIDKDRERKYIGALLVAIWGEDYESKADDLVVTDRNFRRIYSRLHPKGI